MSEFPEDEYILLPEYVLRSQKFLKWVKQQQVRSKDPHFFTIEPSFDNLKIDEDHHIVESQDTTQTKEALDNASTEN